MLGTSIKAAEIDLSSNSISKYKALLDKQNFIYVPVSEADFDWMKFSQMVTGLGLKLQYGKEVFNVRWEPEFINFSDARGKRRLLPHTEASDYPTPPKYLALWCKQPATCGGGITSLAYVEDFLKTLTTAEKQRLLETKHFFGATGGIHSSRTQGATHYILSFLAGKPIFRFSCNYISHGDYSPDPENLRPFTPEPFLAEISERLQKYFDNNFMGIKMQQNSLLLWDNECMLHSRTTYDDPNRQLDRIFLG